MPTMIQFKRGVNANLATATLNAGEPAFVTDTGKLYIGDGTNKILINPIDKPADIDTAVAYTKVTVNPYGQIVSQANLTASDIPIIPSAKVTGLGTAAAINTGTAAGTIPVLDASAKLPTSIIPSLSSSQIPELGSASLKDVGTSSGNIPILDANGKLAASTMPSIAITDTFIVANQTEMLALACEVGDVAIRSDISQTFILQTAPSSTLANWVTLAIPTDAVTSINGMTGAVTLESSNILMTGYSKAASYTTVVATDSTSSAIGKLEKNFDNFAQLASPIFTGTPTSTTPITTDNSTKIATTAYVQNVLSVLDGGTF